MNGIEFYPQKEFDEDMEDKSDNDKIRVSHSVLSFSSVDITLCFKWDWVTPTPFFPPSLIHFKPPKKCLTIHSAFLCTHTCSASKQQNVREARLVLHMFHLINYVQLLSDHWTFLKCLCLQEAMPFAVVGSDKEYQVNGKRVLGRKTAWGVVEGVWHFFNIYNMSLCRRDGIDGFR